MKRITELMPYKIAIKARYSYYYMRKDRFLTNRFITNKFI